MPTLSLNEAVALIVSLRKPHDVEAIRMAMRNALVDGRLRDCRVVGDGFYQGLSTNPAIWRRWFEEGRVNMEKGEVYLRPRPGRVLNVIKPPPIRSLFRHQDVLAVFGITEAPQPRHG